MGSMDILVRAGFTIATDGDDRVVLTPAGKSSQAFNLVVRKQPPRPAKVTSPSNGYWLFYAPEISAAAGIALTEAGWSWLSEHGCDLRARHWHHHSPDAPPASSVPTTRPVRRGRPATVTWSVVRSLVVSSQPVRQVELAANACATQGRVSQVLSTLVDRGLVRRDTSGWVSDDRAQLAAWFIDSYPGPGGIESWWFHLDPVMTQTSLVADTYRSSVLSGDAGADTIAPWRSPTHAVVYSPALLDLTSLGFVPADGVADGSLLVVAAPSDSSVFHAGRVADPLQIAYDLHRLGGADRAEAADRVIKFALQP